MGDKFRLGIVGIGQISIQSHLPAALSSYLVDVTAFIDPVKKRSERVAKKYGLAPIIVEKIEDILDGVDGVIIATPNQTHCNLAIKCAESGIHCLIEKPLSTTIDEAEAIVSCANKHNVVIAVGYATRFRNDVVAFKSILDSGYFGQVNRFIYQFGTVGGWAPMSAYNLSKKLSGGGVLIVTGTHFIDRMLYWFGYPSSYKYEDDSLGGPEANCVVNVKYHKEGSSFDGEIRLSKTMSLEPGFVMETDRGVVIIKDSPPFNIVFRPSLSQGVESILTTRQKKHFDVKKNQFQLQLEDFVLACQGEKKVMADAQQGLESVRLISELYRCRKQLREEL